MELDCSSAVVRAVEAIYSLPWLLFLARCPIQRGERRRTGRYTIKEMLEI
jgi:hypothetical protein